MAVSDYLRDSWNGQKESVGFSADRYLAARLRLPWQGTIEPSSASDRISFGARLGDVERRLVERLAAEPGVSGVAVGNVLPRMQHPTHARIRAGRRAGLASFASDRTFCGRIPAARFRPPAGTLAEPPASLQVPRATARKNRRVMAIGDARIGLLLSILTVALVVAACGTLGTSNPPSDDRGPTSDDLTKEDLTDYSTVMEAVQALRPTWLRERTPLVLSPRSGTEPANPVWVYWDGTRLGDPSYLTRIATSQISRAVYYNARVASFRWGISHENGVIYLVPASGSARMVDKR